MKKHVLFLLLLITCIYCRAQIKVIQGPYTSPDGRYTITFKQDLEKRTVTTIEPTGHTTVYDWVTGNEYRYIHTNGVDYRIMLLSDKTWSSYHPGLAGSANTFTFSGSLTAAATNQNFIDYEKIATKYKEQMTTDPDNIQVYAFCATAALARGMYNAEGFAEYCKVIVASLKQIVVDKTKCPCEDAIPKNVWDAVEN